MTKGLVWTLNILIQLGLLVTQEVLIIEAESLCLAWLLCNQSQKTSVIGISVIIHYYPYESISRYWNHSNLGLSKTSGISNSLLLFLRIFWNSSGIGISMKLFSVSVLVWKYWCWYQYLYVVWALSLAQLSTSLPSYFLHSYPHCSL